MWSFWCAHRIDQTKHRGFNLEIEQNKEASISKKTQLWFQERTKQVRSNLKMEQDITLYQNLHHKMIAKWSEFCAGHVQSNKTYASISNSNKTRRLQSLTCVTEQHYVSIFFTRLNTALISRSNKTSTLQSRNRKDSFGVKIEQKTASISKSNKTQLRSRNRTNHSFDLEIE